MPKGKGGKKPEAQKITSERKSGKAMKQRPKVFDPVKRRLVTKEE